MHIRKALAERNLIHLSGDIMTTKTIRKGYEHYKIINGKKYVAIDGSEYKSIAQKQAESHRKRGLLCRIFVEKVTSLGSGHNKYYRVWGSWDGMR